MQTKDKGNCNNWFYYSVFLSRVISHHPEWLEQPQTRNSVDGISWEQINVEALGYYSNSVLKECAFYHMPPSYWCIFWLTPNVTCKMCTMLWPVFFWPLPDWSEEPYFMLVTPDRGPAALSHAGRAPTDFQTGMYKWGLLDLSLT